MWKLGVAGTSRGILHGGEVVLRIVRLGVKILAAATIPLLTGLSSLNHLF